MLSRKSKNYIFYEFAATFDNETQYLQGFSHKKYHFHALLRINHYNMNPIWDHNQREESRHIPFFPPILLYDRIGANGRKMIKNANFLKRFEDELVKKAPRSSFLNSLSLFEAMWKEGIHFGVLPPSDLMEGIEVDIAVARVLNCLQNSSPE